MIAVVDLKEALGSFAETWAPRLAGRVDGYDIRLAKLEGSFVWHAHPDEDEMFLCLEGRLRMLLREGDAEREVVLTPGQMIVIPKGTEHLPAGDPTASVLLVEKSTTVNTGAAGGERTRAPVAL